MELELPKRLYAEGLEPQVKKINNSCRMELIRDLKKAMSAEYNDVKIDPVFKHIMAIAENKLKLSGKLVDSFLCKQLITSKMHEKWFVFARTPLRFSLQEYHAVTCLKLSRESSSDVVHLKEVHKWTRIDRMRLVYLCVIMGVVMGRYEKVNIPDMYIKLVMDLDKLCKFHWGLHSYDFLLSSIEKARKKLGVAKVSYEDIIQLEESFTEKGDLFSVISVSGNGDVLRDADYTRKDEMEDERVDLLLDRIKYKFDWSNTEWPVIEAEETEMEEADTESEADKSVDDTDIAADVETSSVNVAGRGKRKIQDEGAETRKKKLLYMELELPKRLYAEGLEPQVKKVNNCCRMELIRDLKKAMSAEYNDV
ncbi:hypothetical protein F2Q68_00009122 [Brassica cretica]|uniref:DUF1985 domain-containing protein n=1 Tax=Brassica cretica TaxID=69181 RepID=A0A8S9KZD8_BRACR|nr:hypothetical protein F2Q68_00009122 [Brassica cretica]